MSEQNKYGNFIEKKKSESTFIINIHIQFAVNVNHERISCIRSGLHYITYIYTYLYL